MTDLGAVSIVQTDGSLPTTVAAGSAWPDSAVSIHQWRVRGGAHLATTGKPHLIWFASPARFHCRMAGKVVSHDMPPGSLAIGPAGIDGFADVQGSFDSLLVAVDPVQLALAAAEEDTYEARLVERLLGHDGALAGLARHLADESARGYRNGALYWHELASHFIDGLLLRHSTKPPRPPRGHIGKADFKRLKEFVLAHLDGPIDVAMLSELAGRSPFHFSRVFTRSVGVTPHRFVVHLRLKQAVALLREGRLSLAAIAAHTGFADQSHLSRWARRVYGAPLTQIAN